MTYQDIPGWFDGADVLSYQELSGKVLRGVIVEVGSWMGKSSASIAPICRINGTRVFCVDTWAGYPDQTPENLPQRTDYYTTFLRNVLTFGNQDVLFPIRLTSVEASQLFEPASVNMVFIDAAHDYENCSSDIKSWLPKIKSGGIIAGHDYGKNGGVTWAGVNKAVDELVPGITLPRDGSSVWWKQL